MTDIKRWDYEKQYGNDILVLDLVCGEDLLACMSTGTTFSGIVKPDVKYAVLPSL